MRLLTATLPMLLLPFALGANAHEGQQHQAASAKKEQMPWGIAGDARASVKTIVLSMTDDMRFTPNRIEVEQGQTVRFVVRNSGAIMHEFVMGTKQTLDKHAALMMKFPGMEHDEPYMTHVKAGASGEVTWTFNRPGDFDFACLIAGHFQAGMVGTIKVVPASRNRHSAAPGLSRG